MREQEFPPSRRNSGIITQDLARRYRACMRRTALEIDEETCMSGSNATIPTGSTRYAQGYVVHNDIAPIEAGHKGVL
jgi:hypothetical protein